MGKQLLVSIVAAVLASVATVLILFSLGLDGRHEREERLGQLEREVDERLGAASSRVETALRRVDRAQADAREAREDAASARAASGAPQAAEGATGLTAPDGTAYVSQGELDRILSERAASVGAGGESAPPPRPAKTVAEIAEEMGLSANQEATLEVILRDAETEMLKLLFGDLPVDEIVARARRAKDDPEEQARMIQTVATRAFANLGKIATYETRLKHRIEDALGEELAGDFLSRPRKPVIDDSLQNVFEEMFD